MANSADGWNSMANKPANCHEIVESYLRANGYDGLFNDCDRDGCACKLGDLIPCGVGSVLDCQPGFISYGPGEHDFRITRKQERDADGEA